MRSRSYRRDPTPVSRMTQSKGWIVGPDKDGFISPEQVHLVISFTGEDAHLSGPGTHDMSWVVHALEGLTNQWFPQRQQKAPPPEVVPDGKWRDVTLTDLTVIFFRDCQVIAMPGEVFGDDRGLAAYDLEIVGKKRHDQEYCLDRIRALAEAISEDLANGSIPDRQS